MKVQRFDSSEGNVWKYVFEWDDAITEAVLYRYGSFEERTVLCVSVQSGCPVGCIFCGTGKRFIRNLTSKEITDQVDYVMKDMNIYCRNVSKLQVMFMSMGEPFLNYDNVKEAIHQLTIYYPNAQLLVSTIAPDKKKELQDFINYSEAVNKIGLQFSIHESTDEKRDILIPYKNKLSLAELRDYGIEWWKQTGRKPYCNYCVNGKNNTDEDFRNLRNLFPANVFCFTFSVICSPDETMKEAGFKNLDAINEFCGKFSAVGYNTRVFNPEGQDSIGGGCGQLWYVQNYLKEHE
jgi:23S rRNA (adenine2503-C2)-methyltransferase